MVQAERKSEYFKRLIKLLDEYSKILIVGVDNVGSKHLQEIRGSLRGKAVILMGKNTMIRKAIRGHMKNNPQLEDLLPIIRGNVGFVFTNEELRDIKEICQSNRKPAAAKAGTIAPNDVLVPAGNTGMEPTMTSFLQALNIPSKITRGQVEIINDVELIKAGKKVGSSEAALLGKLNIRPFSYGLTMLNAYDNGQVYAANILDITDEDILRKFSSTVETIAAISLACKYPTAASVPHALGSAFRDLICIALGADYSFKAVDDIKAAIAAGPAVAAAAAPAAGSDKKEEKKEEEEEEDDDVGAGGLFGDDDW